MTGTLEMLLDAWLAHDDRPTGEWTSRALVAANAAFAAERGLSPVDVRRARSAGRRAGLAHDVILDGIVS